MPNAIIEAGKLGQSFWYDTLSRKMLTSGELRAMVERDGLAGVTSNPTIFAKAMGGSADYDPQLRTLVASGVSDPKALYEALAIEDIRGAAAVLKPVYERTAGADGYVSLEVSPHLAHDTAGTVAEARRLFRAVGRENVMIKVPGSPEGMPAIEELVAAGVNINVTLLFGLGAYRACAEAHVAGLERLVSNGGDPARVAGVASFFLSRIDTVVDERLARALAAQPDEERRAKLARLRGKVAVANAKVARADYLTMVTGPRWLALAARGARPQRLLWASTGTKNPAYPKTMYVDPLIGPDTVNTVPAETYQVFRDHGQARLTLNDGLGEARATLAALGEVGISLDEVTDGLLTAGIESFSESFDALLATLERKRQALVGASADQSPSP
jgi:transaldolase/glucose-6-phosphate isomerase